MVGLASPLEAIPDSYDKSEPGFKVVDEKFS